MRRPREQSGYVYKRAGWWVLRYRLTANERGKLRTIQRARRLAPIDVNHRTKRSVAALVKDVLKSVNQSRNSPEFIVTLGDFVSQIYWPFVAAQRKPSTLNGYRSVWKDHPEERGSRMLLREVRTCDVQRWLEAVAAEDRTKDGQPLRHASLARIKSLLSGILAHAKRQGFYDGVNPAQSTAIPPAPKAGETYTYSLEQVVEMLNILPEPARTIVAVAAFTGLRRGEIQGLRWEDFHDESVYVERSMWESHITEPKTRASKAPVPVISPLAAMLESHRQSLGYPASGAIFPARNGHPLRLNNVLREIKSALGRDATLPQWHGWKPFRSGLATNLNRLGVQDKTIQAILRHSNVSTTMNIYVKAVQADSVTAMANLETLLCANRAPGAAFFPSTAVN